MTLQEEGKEDWVRYLELLNALRSLIFDHADTRSWANLPDRIQLSSLVVPAGEHSVTLDHMSQAGPVGQEIIPNISVREGKRTFVVVRTGK